MLSRATRHRWRWSIWPPPTPAPAVELTAYAGGAPAGAAAFTMDNSQEIRTTTHDRAASAAFWDALNAPRATTACAASVPRCLHGG